MVLHGLVDGEVEAEGDHQERIDKDDMYALMVREQHDDDQSIDEDCKTPEESASDEATTGGSETKQLKAWRSTRRLRMRCRPELRSKSSASVARPRPQARARARIGRSCVSRVSEACSVLCAIEFNLSILAPN